MPLALVLDARVFIAAKLELSTVGVCEGDSFLDGSVSARHECNLLSD